MARVVLRGRAGELGRALDTVRRTQRTSRSAVLTVTGPAGIGRTAFLDALAVESAALGFRVGAGGGGTSAPSFPGAQLLVALRSGPAPLLDHEAFSSLASLYDREVWLVDRVGELLADLAARTPVVIVVDDVHRADELTRFALRLLPARLADAPLVWALGSRSGVTEVVDDIVATAGPATAVTKVVLGPVTDRDVDDIARDHLDHAPDPAVRDLLQSAGGIPSWVVQLLAGIDGQLPTEPPELQAQADLLRTTRERMAEMPAHAADLVRVAAVWDRPLPMATAAAVLVDQSVVQVADASRFALADGLLTRHDGELRFPHRWVCEVVYGDLDVEQRRLLHLRCARHLLDTGDRLTAARHLRAGATPGDSAAADTLIRAAASQLDSSAGEAAVLARSAWALTDRASATSAALAARVVDVLQDTERHLDAVEVADAVLAALPADARGDRARWQVRAVRSLVAASAWDRARDRIEAALGGERVDPRDRQVLDAARAVVDAMTRPRSALPEVRDAAGRLTSGAAPTGGGALTRRLAVLAAVDCDRREMRHGSAWALLGGTVTAADVDLTVERIRTLQDLDRHAAAAAELETVGAGAAGGPEVDGLRPGVLVVAARQDLDLGRLDDAAARARRLQVAADETRDPVHHAAARALLAEVALHRGTEVESHEDTDANVVEWSSGLRVVHAATLLVAGDSESAVHLVLPVVAAYRVGFCATMWSPQWTPLLARIALAAGDRDLAAQVGAVAARAATHNPDVASWVGTAAQIAGLVGEDRTLLATAVDTLRATPRPLVLASALEDLGAAALRDGESDAARSSLTEAAGIYRRCRADASEHRVIAVLERAGLRRRRPPATRSAGGWSSLTEGELVVARLVSAGHTNRSAAAELGVSPNTVGSHLRSAFGKLGVRSRVQLTNLVHENT
ncbi:LuxR C-terminal-related transcriptional regulator [Jatrophihabitans sp. YIM 134969]